MTLTVTMTKEELNKLCSLIGELDKGKATITKKVLTENNKYTFGSILIDVNENTVKVDINKKAFMSLSSDIAMKLFMMNMTAFMKRFIEKNNGIIPAPENNDHPEEVIVDEDAVEPYDDEDDIEPAEVESFVCDGILVYNV